MVVRRAATNGCVRLMFCFSVLLCSSRCVLLVLISPVQMLAISNAKILQSSSSQIFRMLFQLHLLVVSPS
jgi:hypothetical protein